MLTLIKNIVVILGDPRKSDPVKPGGIFDEDDFETIRKLKEALNKIENINFTFLDNHDTLEEDLIKLKDNTDFVFNLCDEGFNNDPKHEADIPDLLTRLEIPYTGASREGLVTCYDKHLVKVYAEKLGVPTAKFYLLKENENEIDEEISFPVIVKPAQGDGSFGINKDSVVKNNKELNKAILTLRTKFKYNGKILIEEFLSGDDVMVGILGNPPYSYKVLPMIKEDYGTLPEDLPKICGSEAKWEPESAYWKCIKSVPVILDKSTKKLVEDGSLKMFQYMKCKDYARFDWRLNENGEPKLLEVNPNPGWCWDSHLSTMFSLENFSYPEMLKLILSEAEKRIKLSKTKITIKNRIISS
ncbi:MAG: hypothetical protein PHE43_00880 [Candidatus Nanoarchaeia archaeon]|nr:hypothetical protein [Candidatus Nanoarchaeia archaeon]